jgi:hypothetical protein
MERQMAKPHPTHLFPPEDPTDLKATDLVTPSVAAGILKKHLVTLAVWRRQRRGPAFVQGDDVRAVLYRVGALWEWAARNTIDPSKASAAKNPPKSSNQI